MSMAPPARSTATTPALAGENSGTERGIGTVEGGEADATPTSNAEPRITAETIDQKRLIDSPFPALLLAALRVGTRSLSSARRRSQLPFLTDNGSVASLEGRMRVRSVNMPCHGGGTA